METVTWAQVLGRRMRRQFLDPPVGGDPVEVARHLAGVRAQVASVVLRAFLGAYGCPARRLFARSREAVRWSARLWVQIVLTRSVVRWCFLWKSDTDGLREW